MSLSFEIQIKEIQHVLLIMMKVNTDTLHRHHFCVNSEQRITSMMKEFYRNYQPQVLSKTNEFEIISNPIFILYGLVLVIFAVFSHIQRLSYTLHVVFHIHRTKEHNVRKVMRILILFQIKIQMSYPKIYIYSPSNTTVFKVQPQQAW